MSGLWFNTSTDFKRNLPSNPVYRFSVRAVVDPSVLSRVVELFVLRDLIPAHVECRRLHAPAPGLQVDVAVDGLEPDQAEHLALRIRQFPTVLSVLMEQSVPAAVRQSA